MDPDNIEAAKQIIDSAQFIPELPVDQKVQLAKAHYTLATDHELPQEMCKIHVNAAITLWQENHSQSDDCMADLSMAYFTRAEWAESELRLPQAARDYQRVIETLQAKTCLDDTENLLQAQSAIAIASMQLNAELPEEMVLDTPLHYVKTALRASHNAEKTPEMNATLAYAYQVAGMALGISQFKTAKRSFQQAIQFAFSAPDDMAPSLLSDLYFCQGLLYEQKMNALYLTNDRRQDALCASIYFCLSQLYAEEDWEMDEHCRQAIDDLLELFRLYPGTWQTPIPPEVLKNFVDGLSFLFNCLQKQTLPNPMLADWLANPDICETIHQCMEGYLMICLAQAYPHYQLMNIEANFDFDYQTEIKTFIDGIPDNVFYLSQFRKSA